MYLKEIATSGFKSFADKIKIKLDGKITCIVGPNGSGKSNVVDAVRWVLGEQSIKSLRGDGSMSDVIFSGSKSRNPLNVASVELIFDNHDHFLNIPYTEFSIKRRVYRSGENEYYLNGEKCRLKDINNLLMDSAIGKESFNIISQGEVDRILSNSSMERRLIFEEAAGIIKYKKRKEEALKKLDKTHNNMERVNDIINELSMQVRPLKEQSEKAKEYLKAKEELDKYEISLLVYDIEKNNQELEQIKIKQEKTNQEIMTISLENSKLDANYLKENTKLDKLEQENKELSKKLLQVTEEVERLNGEKKLIKEKSKSTKEENVIKEEIRNLLEQKANLEKEMILLQEEEKELEKDQKTQELQKEEQGKNLDRLKKKDQILKDEYTKRDQELITLKNTIDNLQIELAQGVDVPNSVKSILKEPNLEGIYNTIGNLLSTKDEYAKALNIAITSNKNFIITEDEESAKKAVEYLKEKKLGRLTFFPLSIIKERTIDENSLNQLKKSNDFIGILSDLISYDKKYQNIMKNQFGIIGIVKNIDAATKLSKQINRKYKLITLDGDVVNVGGSISGGSTYQRRSAITVKQQLHYIEEKRNILIMDQQNTIENREKLTKQIQEQEEKLYSYTKEIIILQEKYHQKEKQVEITKNKYEEIKKEWENLEALKNNTLSDKEQELIQKEQEKQKEKELIIMRLTYLKKEIEQLKEVIEQQQANNKLTTNQLRLLEKEQNQLEITKNRLDVKIDNMLLALNQEHELTFEKAKKNYELDIEEESARKKVIHYKETIKRIGMINLGAIEEYERVNTRYEFLMNQKEDLQKAEETLLEIMNQMDEVMIEEFTTSFQKIKKEFQKVFKELFGGGTADLRLTDPENILTTGIDIVASPPGKKLTTITLLSGGEKTLTAISLLFAILNVRTVPFCLFDEVEAALDEANVDQFGKYLDHYRDKTQFLIITHKKKTMEYANTLYGITMQESGVSKLVSVKLENHEEIL